MTAKDIKNQDADKAFEGFDADDLETLEVTDGVALPKMGLQRLDRHLVPLVQHLPGLLNRRHGTSTTA